MLQISVTMFYLQTKLTVLLGLFYPRHRPFRNNLKKTQKSNSNCCFLDFWQILKILISIVLISYKGLLFQLCEFLLLDLLLLKSNSTCKHLLYDVMVFTLSLAFSFTQFPNISWDFKEFLSFIIHRPAFSIFFSPWSRIQYLLLILIQPFIDSSTNLNSLHSSGYSTASSSFRTDIHVGETFSYYFSELILTQNWKLVNCICSSLNSCRQIRDHFYNSCSLKNCSYSCEQFFF